MAPISKREITIDGRIRRPWALASKDRILAAATAEIASVGFERARLTDIAHRAEMTPGSVYTWFENKEDLFRAALEDALTSQIARNAAVHDSDGYRDSWLLQVLTLIPRNTQDVEATDAQMLLIESYYAAWRDPKARKNLLKGLTSHLEMYNTILTKAQAEGHIAPDVDAEALALLLLAIPTGLSLLNLAGLPRIKDASWPNIYQLFRNFLKS